MREFRVLLGCEIVRHRRRAIVYVVAIGQIATVVVLHLLFDAPDSGIPQAPYYTSTTWTLLLHLVQMPVLALGTVLLFLPLLSADRIPGAQQAILLTGLGEHVFGLAKICASLLMSGCLMILVTTLSLVGTFARYHSLPWQEGIADSLILVFPATLFTACLCLFVGGLVSTLLVQLLTITILWFGVDYVVRLLLAKWSPDLTAFILDPFMRFLYPQIIGGWNSALIDRTEVWKNVCLLDFEWNQILLQRAFVVSMSIVLLIGACGTIRVKEIDFAHWTERRNLPFRGIVPHLIVFQGRKKAFWLVISISTLLAAFLFAAAALTLTEREERMARLRNAAPMGQAHQNGGRADALRIQSVAIDIRPGTRMRPMEGSTMYHLSCEAAGEMRFVMNPGLTVRGVTMDGVPVHARQADDMIEVTPPRILTGSHLVKIKFGGFIDNYYRVVLAKDRRWAVPGCLSYYYYKPAAPALTRATSSHAWLMADDVWFPRPLSISGTNIAEYAIDVRVPAHWNVAAPTETMAVDRVGNDAHFKFKGMLSPSEIASISIAAGAYQRLDGPQGSGAVILHEPWRDIRPTISVGAFWKACDQIRKLVSNQHRQVFMAVSVNTSTELEMSAVDCGLMLFDPASTMDKRTFLRHLDHLIPRTLSTGHAAFDAFFTPGLSDFLTSQIRTSLGITKYAPAGLAQRAELGQRIAEREDLVTFHDRVTGPTVPLGEVSMMRERALANSASATPDPPHEVANTWRTARKAQRLLFALLKIVGSEAFHASVRDLFDEFAFKRASPDDLMLIMQKNSGQDLGWFWHDYFYDAKLPHYEVTKAEAQGGGKVYELAVTILNRGSGRMRVPVRIEMDGDVWNEDLFIDQSYELRLSLPGRPRMVKVDPQRQVYRVQTPASAQVDYVQ